MRPTGRWLSLVAAVALGAAGALLLRRPASKALPDGPTVLMRVREVARLETLDATLYKKVSFAPDPAANDSLWGDLKSWVRFNLRPSHGRAIVFARAHAGLDLSRLDAGHLAIHGATVELVLPPIQTRVELLPGETEVIDSNLDSAQTAQLLELARQGFERELQESPELQQQARRSAENALRTLLHGLGFKEVRFVSAVGGAS